MTRMVRHARVVVLLAVVTTAACGDRDGAAMRPDADRTAPAATPPSSGLGEAVANGGRAADAAVETLDVKMALVADDRIETDDLNVDTDHTTKTVRLRGSVPTEAQKSIAEQVAQQKAPGYRVSNELAVGRSPR